MEVAILLLCESDENLLFRFTNQSGTYYVMGATTFAGSLSNHRKKDNFPESVEYFENIKYISMAF